MMPRSMPMPGRCRFSTPNIDGIAADGMPFMQAYANSAVCTASRVALIAGRYHYRLTVGLEEPLPSRETRKVGSPPEHPTLPSILKKAGYRSTLVGKWHLGRLPDFGPLQSGYDHFYGFRGGALDYYTHKYGPPASDTEDLWDDNTSVRQPGYLTDLLGSRAVDVVDAYAKSGQPFLVSLHFNAPHWPWEAPGDEAESHRLKSSVLSDTYSGRVSAARGARHEPRQLRRTAEMVESGRCCCVNRTASGRRFRPFGMRCESHRSVETFDLRSIIRAGAPSDVPEKAKRRSKPSTARSGRS